MLAVSYTHLDVYKRQKNGRIITNKKAALLIANVIKGTIGIPLTEEEENAEVALAKILNE